MRTLCVLLAAVGLMGCVAVPVGPPADYYGYGYGYGYVEPSATIVVRPRSRYEGYGWHRDDRHRWRRW